MFTLHNGDCLEYMKTLQPSSVDCVITDPPYLLNNGNGSGGFLKKTSITHRLNFIESGFDSTAWFAEVKRVCKKVNCFIFCSNNQVAELLTLGDEYITTLLVWHKPNVPPFSNGTWLQDVEFIVHIRESGATFKGETKLKKKVVTLPKEVHETDHPAEKPVSLIKRYLQIGTNEGDIVLDTYMGSGTVGVACLELQRSFIGCELLPEYFAMAEKRIKSAALQPSLFTPSNNRDRRAPGGGDARGLGVGPRDAAGERREPGRRGRSSGGPPPDLRGGAARPHGEHAQGHAEEVARHLVAAGDLEEALAPLLDATYQMQLSGQYERAERVLAEHAGLADRLGFGPDDVRRLRGRMQTVWLTWMRGGEGTLQEARSRCREIAAAARRGGHDDVLGESLRWHGLVARFERRWDESLAALEQAAVCFAGPSNPFLAVALTPISVTFVTSFATIATLFTLDAVPSAASTSRSLSATFPAGFARLTA